MSKFDHVVDMIFDDDLESAQESMLLESEEAHVVRQLGDPTLMNYLMKFEQYLDDHDIYLFDGWDKATVIKKPEIDKFWCVFYMGLPKDTDEKFAYRIVNDKEAQNRISKKEYGGGIVYKFKILKRLLDKIEIDDQSRADELADDELERI